MDVSHFGLESRLGEHAERVDVIAIELGANAEFGKHAGVDAWGCAGGHGDTAATSRDRGKLAQRASQVGNRDGARCECDIGHVLAKAELAPIVFPAHAQRENAAWRERIKALGDLDVAKGHVLAQFCEHSAAEIAHDDLMAACGHFCGERSRSATHVEYRFARLHACELDECLGVEVFRIAGIVACGLFVPSLAVVGRLGRLLQMAPCRVEIDHAIPPA